MKRTKALVVLAVLLSSATTLQADECVLTDLPCYTQKDNKKCNIKFTNRTGFATGPFTTYKGWIQKSSAQTIEVFATHSDDKGVRGGKLRIEAGASAKLNLTSDNKLKKGFSEIRIVGKYGKDRVGISCPVIRQILQEDTAPGCGVAILLHKVKGAYSAIGYDCEGYRDFANTKGEKRD